MNFPDHQSLCEQCGYALRDLSPDGRCPECNLLIEQSSPVQRTGLAWQHQTTPIAWLRTSMNILIRPTRSFRMMTVGRSNSHINNTHSSRSHNININSPTNHAARARLFLVSYVLLISLGWSGLWWIARLRHAWLWGLGAGLGVVIMTYVETIGVTYFSARRGWRVPFHLAEQVTCFASVGWLPTAIITVKISLLIETQWLVRHGYWPWRVLGPLTPVMGYLLILVGASISLMWFEILVWLGMRQVRYANPS